MKRLLLSLCIFMGMSSIYSQVIQTDTNTINDILNDEIKQVEKSKATQAKEKKIAHEKMIEFPVTKSTKKNAVLHEKLAEIHVGHLTLSDGSQWIVQSEDVPKTLLWRINDKIQVRIEKGVDPIKGFTSTFSNLSRKQTVSVRLEIFSSVPSPISRFLQKDPKQLVKDLHSIARNIRSGSIIQLHNGSKFNVAPLDMIISRYWTNDQSIAIQKKKHDAHPYYLMNKTTNDKVSANLIKPPNPPYKLKFESKIFSDLKYKEELKDSLEVDRKYIGPK